MNHLLLMLTSLRRRWFRYNPPIEAKVVAPIKVEEKTITYNVDPVVPTSYIEKPPFPVRIKDHAVTSLALLCTWTSLVVASCLNLLES